jgi:hypothetical protein
MRLVQFIVFLPACLSLADFPRPNGAPAVVLRHSICETFSKILSPHHEAAVPGTSNNDVEMFGHELRGGQ